jgi:Delta7-sterol 5-desaturase
VNGVRAVLLAATLVAAPLSRAHEIAGEWATQGYTARVRIALCAGDAELLCGTIVWLWEAVDDEGAPIVDRNNPSPELRSRSLVGVSPLKNFRMRDAKHWAEGSIYDPESGRTYKASLTLRSPDILELEGCMLFVCRKQVWRRAQSACASIHEI